MTRQAVDVSALPNHAFGHRGLIWWGTVGFMVIEGSLFLMAITAYYFLRLRSDTWPPSVPLPDPTFGTLNTLLLIVSCVPNQLTRRAAERFDLGAVRRWLIICAIAGILFIVIRMFEFTTLGVRWHTNAYGSIVYFIMWLHSTHLITDVIDTGVLTALMFTRHAAPKRMVDVSENALYWYFVVLSWLPLYFTVYWAPRWL